MQNFIPPISLYGIKNFSYLIVKVAAIAPYDALSLQIH